MDSESGSDSPATAPASTTARRLLSAFAAAFALAVLCVLVGPWSCTSIVPPKQPDEGHVAVANGLEVVSSAEKNGDLICLQDGPDGELLHMPAEFLGAINPSCLVYIYDNRAWHTIIDKTTCDTMESTPMVYPGIKCCRQNLCNKEPNKVQKPPYCYSDSLDKGLLQTEVTADMDCVTYRHASDGVIHTFGPPGFCDMMRNTMRNDPSGLISNVTCCSEDLCNVLPGEAEVTCEDDTLRFSFQKGAATCAKYVEAGVVTRKIVTEAQCKSFQESPILEDVMCCDTDMCNIG